MKIQKMAPDCGTILESTRRLSCFRVHLKLFTRFHFFIFLSLRNLDFAILAKIKTENKITIFDVFINNSYLYIKAAKSFFNVRRENLSRRPLAGEARC
jgi:hypothetical protein